MSEVLDSLADVSEQLEDRTRNSSVTSLSDLSSDPIEVMYWQTFLLGRDDAVEASDFMTDELKKLNGIQGNSLETSLLSPIFYATIYKKARVEMCSRLGIPFLDSIYDDIENIASYCEEVGVSFSSKLHELGGLNALGSNNLVDVSKLLVAWTQMYEEAQEKNLFGQKIVHKEDTEEGHLTAEFQFNGPPEEEKPSLDNFDVEKLLMYFILERRYTNEFAENAKGASDLRLGDECFSFCPTKGVLVYDSKTAGFKSAVGNIVFNPLNHSGKAYKFFTDFFQTLVGDDLATPVSIIEAEDGAYNVMLHESDDLEVFLGSDADPYEKYKAIADDLMKHARLEEALVPYTIHEDNNVNMKVRLFEGLVTIWLTFTVPQHDYEKEMLESLVLGRDSDMKTRLAKESEYDIQDGEKPEDRKRSIVLGVNPVLDDLSEKGRQFISDYLSIEGLEALNCFVDLDAQPSNYFVNGKINDLDKIKYGSPVYTAARLLGHPSVQSFLAGLDGDSEEKFFERYVQESDDHNVKRASESVKNNLGFVRDDHLFGLYAARKLNAVNASCDDSMAAKLHLSFDAHKAYINAFHVMSYECRADDRDSAVGYLRIALDQLDRPEFMDFREAYVGAIGQSKHAHLLEKL